MHYQRLFAPANIGGKRIKNRIMMAPMATGFASNSGEVTDASVAYYETRARGGVGTIIVEAACVDAPVGREGFQQIRIDNPAYLAGLSRLAEAIKSHGSTAFIQLFHAGRQTNDLLTGGEAPVAPSPIPCPIMRTMPRELTTLEVEQIRDHFIQSAALASQAGFDGVELHAAHGYLINQFISPHTNRRSDKYGGSLTNRIRLMLEIIDGVKHIDPQLLISVRLNLDDFEAEGLHLEESLQICRELEKAGIHLLHVSCGTYPSGLNSIEPSSYQEGWRMYLAEAAKKTVNLPVIGGGLIRHPAFAEQVLEQGQADFVFLGRPLLADPYWVRKTQNNQEHSIRPCIVCNECIGNNFRGLPVRCTVNPHCGREHGRSALTRRRTADRRAVVVGSGPAGMQAALTLSQQGIKVAIFEQDLKLGGLLNLAAIPPHKHRIQMLRDYMYRQLIHSDIEIMAGQAFDTYQLQTQSPDYIILATGSTPAIPAEWRISAGSKGYDVNQILNMPRLPEGQRTAVIGGGQSGCEVADFLAAHGKQAVIIERQKTLAVNMEKKNRRDLINRLDEAGVERRLGCRVESVDQGNVLIVESDGQPCRINSDWLVFAMGNHPNQQLYEQLNCLHPRVYLIGDAHRIGGIRAAIIQGWKVAEQIVREDE